MRRRLRTIIGISLFWLALSMLFDGMNSLVLPNRLAELVGVSRQATVLGLLTFMGLLAGMLVQPIAGAWSDRVRPGLGRRGVIGIGVVLILAALAVFGWVPGLAATIAGYVLIQVAASVGQAAQQGFIPDLVAKKERGVASGLKGFMDLGGATVGFVLLGQLLGDGQARQALLAIAAVVVVTYLLTVILVREEKATVQVETRKRTGLREAFQIDLKQHRRFAWVVATRFLFLLPTFAIGRFLLYFVAGRLGLSPDQAAEQAGTLLAGLGLVTLLAAPPAGWAADRWGRIPLMAAGTMLSALGALSFIPAQTSAQFFFAGLWLALGSGAFAGANWAMTADLAPPEQAGRFYGLANFGTAGAAAAAGLFGPLVDYAGFNGLFVLSTLLFTASGVALFALRQTPLSDDRLSGGKPSDPQFIQAPSDWDT